MAISIPAKNISAAYQCMGCLHRGKVESAGKSEKMAILGHFRQKTSFWYPIPRILMHFDDIYGKSRQSESVSELLV